MKILITMRVNGRWNRWWTKYWRIRNNDDIDESPDEFTTGKIQI